MAAAWSGPQVEAGAPSAGPPPSVSSAPAKETRPSLPPARRDPVLPPLAEQSAWREWLLSVRLNGQAVSLGGLFVESPDGTLAAQLALLDAWRIRTDANRVITFQGAPYYPLEAIPGAAIHLDHDALALTLEVPPDQFTPYVAEPGDTERLRPVAGTGGFLDYDFIYQAGDDLDQGISGLAELGGFHAGNTLLSGLLLQDLTTDPEVVRLDSGA